MMQENGNPSCISHWKHIETALGGPLPDSYKSFVNRTGGVVKANKDLRLLNPLDNTDFYGVNEFLDMHAAYNQAAKDLGSDLFPYEAGFSSNGIIFFGKTIFDERFCFLNDGKKCLNVIIALDEEDFFIQSYDLNFDKFVIMLTSGNLLI